MNVTNYKCQDKMEDEIWAIKIPEGLFEKWARKTSIRLVDK